MIKRRSILAQIGQIPVVFEGHYVTMRRSCGPNKAFHAAMLLTRHFVKMAILDVRNGK
jgi:hypothetical protein